MLQLVISKAERERGHPLRTNMALVLGLSLIFVGALDVATTNLALAAGNFEANPLVRALQGAFGPWWALPKMVVHLLFAWFLVWLPSQRMILIGAGVVVMFLAIAANNFALAAA
ncbi:MAG: DUF5658 family protein [Rhodospirillales bacterium]|nr:DUF5658 family protein [Rhodospirillales bacterium]